MLYPMHSRGRTADYTGDPEPLLRDTPYSGIVRCARICPYDLIAALTLGASGSLALRLEVDNVTLVDAEAFRLARAVADFHASAMADEAATAAAETELLKACRAAKACAWQPLLGHYREIVGTDADAAVTAGLLVVLCCNYDRCLYGLQASAADSWIDDGPAGATWGCVACGGALPAVDAAWPDGPAPRREGPQQRSSAEVAAFLLQHAVRRGDDWGDPGARGAFVPVQFAPAWIGEQRCFLVDQVKPVIVNRWGLGYDACEILTLDPLGRIAEAAHAWDLCDGAVQEITPQRMARFLEVLLGSSADLAE